MDERAAAGKDQSEDPARRHDIAEAHQRQQRLIGGERRTAQEIVDDPPQRQRHDSDRRRLPGLERHHRGIDQKERRLAIIDPAEQRKAAHPGPVGLPFVPDEMLGQRGGREQVLPHFIEAAAVHLPGCPFERRIVARLLAQGGVEMHEEERPADPRDRRGHMEPTKQRRTPFPAEGLQRPHQPASSAQHVCARLDHDKGGGGVWVGSRASLGRPASARAPLSKTGSGLAARQARGELITRR